LPAIDEPVTLCGMSRWGRSTALAAVAMLALHGASAAQAGNTWQPIASPGVGIDHVALASTASAVYAIGGRCVSGPLCVSGVSRGVARLDLASMTWQAAAPLPQPVTNAAAVAAPNGQVWVMGGTEDPSGCCASTRVFVSPTPPWHDAWSAGPALPAARQDAAAAVGGDGRIYLIGGEDASGNSVASVFALDPQTLAWTQVAPLPAPAQDLAATTNATGVVYAIGGRDVQGSAVTASSSVSEFLPSTDSWLTGGSPLPAPSFGLAAATWGYTVLAIGGSGTTSVLETGWPEWQAGPPLHEGLSFGAAATAPDGSVVVLGADAERLPAPAPAPRTFPGDVTPTSASLVGAIQWWGSPARWRFEWGPTTAYGQETAWVDMTQAPPTPEWIVQADITGLLPGHPYHERLDTTSGDDVAFSSDHQFTTRDHEPPTIRLDLPAGCHGDVCAGPVARWRVVRGVVSDDSAPGVSRVSISLLRRDATGCAVFTGSGLRRQPCDKTVPPIRVATYHVTSFSQLLPGLRPSRYVLDVNAVDYQFNRRTLRLTLRLR
jgi:hypothetical protein